MVEKLFPTVVPLMAEVDMDEEVVFRPDGFCNELHAGLFGCPAALLHVAFCAGTDYVAPG